MVYVKKILGVTLINEKIAPSLLKLPVDVDGKISAAGRDRLAEFAARVCYASEGKIGQAEGFINDRIAQGHDDVIEHFWITAELGVLEIWELSNVMFAIKNNFPWARIREAYNGNIIVSANGRVWRYLLNFLMRVYKTVTNNILMIAPESLGAPKHFTDNLNSFGSAHNLCDTISLNGFTTKTGADVTLLGAMPTAAENYSAATFLIENISRAAATQFTRHRLLSFSQESQRYVDIEKGANTIMIPESISSNPQFFYRYLDLWEEIQLLYRDMRTALIRKEDARSILPQALSTRFVVTGSNEGWSHFLKLRMDKSAQAEIRYIAEAIYEMSKPFMDIKLQ